MKANVKYIFQYCCSIVATINSLFFNEIINLISTRPTLQTELLKCLKIK